ncbi:MAG: DUF4956 domain-containing protein [Muribaculaceae bacterium]|nr:DUF4956 domain-containing protein [Muribaculaceae bacterium]
MEDFDFIDTPLIASLDLWQMLLRFAFNSFVVWLIIHKLYFPKSRRCDYYFTFALISVSIFFLIYLLGGVKIKVGFALGLFAIFGIIRYRTESMLVREMTYLFVIIAVSVINALAVTLSIAELVLTNFIFLLCIRFCENIPKLKHVSEKLVLYDRIELICPDRREELLEDLHKRLGLNILRVEVGAVNFLQDTAMLKVFYESEEDKSSNAINHMLKFPKEERP